MDAVLKRLLRITPELMLRTMLIALTVLFVRGIISESFDSEVPWLALLLAAGAVWIPMTVGLYSRGGETAFRPWRKLDRRQQLRQWAGLLWTTPVGLLFPLWLAPLHEPSLLIEYRDLFALLFGLPFAGAAALYLYAARVSPNG